MQQRPAQLQSLSFALDGSRRADAAESENASLGSRHAISAGGGVIVLRLERECVWYEVVRGWVGRHERVGAADGRAGQGSGTADQRDGASFYCAGKLESLSTLLITFLSSSSSFATPGARFLRSVDSSFSAHMIDYT